MKALSSVFDRIRLEGDPVANVGSLIATRHARFTLLTQRLIRLEWATDGQFEDRSTFAFPNRHAEVPIFSCENHESRYDIKTDYLHLTYTDDGTPFSPANLAIRVRVDDETWVTWMPGAAATGNLRGTFRTLDQCADAVNLDEGILSRDGWAVFNDSGTPVWDTDQTWVEARPEAHVQDWYFFGYGHAYKAALKEYIQFGGPIPLIPRFVLGAWWSRFWAYHADDLKALVKDFDAHDVPLDVLVVDMDWHTPKGWTGYSWNRDLFPDPPAFLAWVHEQGLHTTFNLHPAEGILSHEDAHAEFAKRLGRPAGSTDPIHFNGTDKAFIQNYFELLHHPMEEQGVDFWWLDWQQGDVSDMRNLDPLTWLNHLHFRDSTRRGTRPMLYSRWGGLGNHRYYIGFSGDTYATWDALHFQPYFTATAANVGYGWWSHDIGGHFGAVEPELYARWVQYGAVSPCLRLHSTKDPLAERRPWGFSPEVYQVAKAAFQFRYHILPYLYSSAWTASQQGLSLCYPMYYEHPDREEAYLARDQYMFGSRMIAAPITQPADPQTGLAYVDVWVPDGTWIEFTTLEEFTGPRWVRLFGDLNRIPLLVKAGSVIPMSASAHRTWEIDGSHLVLTVFPGADGQFTYYEDDGNTDTYQRGSYEVTRIAISSRAEDEISLQVASSDGYCASLSSLRSFEIRWRAVSVPNHINVNGKHYDNWHYDQSTRVLTVRIDQVHRRDSLEVVVYFAHVRLSVHPDPATRLLLADVVKLTRISPPIASMGAAWQALAAEPDTINPNVVSRLGGPFVHIHEAVVHTDARQHLGTLVIVPPTDNSTYDADIVWSIRCDGKLTNAAPISIERCLGQQILTCPFKDEGEAHTFQWSVEIVLTWHGLTIRQRHDSRVCYPAITHWQTLMMNPDQALSSVFATDGTPNAALNWHSAAQSRQSAPNLHQPFGVVFLEQERKRITDGEPLAAYLSGILTSQTEQEIVLCVHHVGDAKCFIDGTELIATDPLQHTYLAPMFFSWLITRRTYYKATLRPGENRVTIYSTPDRATSWWAVGATAFNPSGSLLV